MRKLAVVVELLAKVGTVPVKYRPRKLSGNYNDKWELHIEPDWLLIYEVYENAITLVRMGTHADLFD